MVESEQGYGHHESLTQLSEADVSSWLELVNYFISSAGYLSSNHWHITYCQLTTVAAYPSMEVGSYIWYDNQLTSSNQSPTVKT